MNNSTQTLFVYEASPEAEELLLEWRYQLSLVTHRYQQKMNELVTPPAPSVYWQSKDGRRTKIEDLADTHLRCILSLHYIHNNSKYVHLLKEYVKRFPEYKVLVGNRQQRLVDVINQYGGWQELASFKKYINQLMAY